MKPVSRGLLALTCGEPAGIGPELCLQLASRELPAPVVAIGDARVLEDRAARLSLDVEVARLAEGDAPETHTPGQLPLIHIPFENTDCLGQPDPRNAPALLAGLDRAIDGCLEGAFAAMVTAPLSKQVINDAGVAFSGHTEYVAARCGSEKPVMLLACDAMRVALATTHLPLRDVADALTTDNITEVLHVLLADLQLRFGVDRPHVAVCGLNPHAGEGGHLGHEDDAIVRPAIERAQAAGYHVTGPHPADTVFNHAGEDADAILAMYHDQGLPVIKYAGFGTIVNVTLGLPIIRTSVDHGTALDIAGTGRADAESLLAAVELAHQLHSARQ